MLGPADLSALVNYKFKATELKDFLKELGLKVSGRKDKLISRLIDHDADSMRRATQELEIYKCTEPGMQLAQNYLERERVKKVSAEQEALFCLQRGDLIGAVDVNHRYGVGT